MFSLSIAGRWLWYRSRNM